MAKYFIESEAHSGHMLRFCVKAVSFDNAVSKADRFIENHVRWFDRKKIGVRLHGEDYDIPHNWKPVSLANGGDVIENAPL